MAHTLCDLRNLNAISLEELDERFQRAAHRLLNETQLVAFEQNCQLLEIEFYYCGGFHRDPFAHQHEIQSRFGHWYLHRVGKGYRGGSYKGLDVTFGENGSFGGVLIRSLKTHDGDIICGPSLCVDFLIQCSGCDSVCDLDDHINSRQAHDPTNPLRLESPASNRSNQVDLQVFRSPRVGLSTARVSAAAHPERFVNGHFRFLTHPREIKKGRGLLIQGMYQAGISPEQICSLTGSPRKSVATFIALSK